MAIILEEYPKSYIKDKSGLIFYSKHNFYQFTNIIASHQKVNEGYQFKIFN